MRLREIKALIKLLQGTDVQELELVRGDTRIKLTRGVVVASGARVEEASKGAGTKPQKVTKTITSPMVGTFYRSPSPDAPPFVEEGSMVRKGQILCIVEAMKLMNEIQSEFDCKIVSVLVGNAQPVEYGEPLFLVEDI